MQNKKHKKIGSQELKIGTIYEGVRKENGRRKLVGKKVYAGLEQAEIFHEKKESKIESIYKTNLIQTRILNGDGDKWIQEDVLEKNRIYQLDRFHVHQAINRGINVDKEVAVEVRRLYNKCEIEEMLRQIKIYADSTDNGEKFDTRSEKARELLAYLSNNKESLIPYYKRNLKLLKLPEGLKYARMGVQENQNCTVITMRMSGGRKRWSQKGGNNFAKILYTKENDELKYDDIKTIKTKEIVKNIVKQTIQKHTVNKYYDVFNAHVPLREAARTPAMNAFLEACF